MRDQDLFLPRLMVRDHSCSEELGVEQKQQERLRCHRQEFGKGASEGSGDELKANQEASGRNGSQTCLI